LPLLAVFTAFLCTIVSPVLAKVPTVNSIVQSSAPATAVADGGEQGKILYEAGQYSEAVKVLQQAVEEYQAQGDSLRQAAGLSNLSLAYQQLGLWSEARSAIAQSLNLLQTEPTVNRSANRLKVLAQTLNIQGRLQFAQGQAETALATWQQAAATYEQVGDEAGATKSRLNQAQALQTLGLYRRASTLLTQVKQSFDVQPDSLTKAVGLRSLGDVLQLVGDLDQSRQTLEESLAIARRLPSPQNISAALLSLGNTARAQQQVQEALGFYQQAVTEATSTTTKLQAQLNQLNVLVETTQWSQAQLLWTQIQPQLGTLPPSRAAVYIRVNFAQSLMKLAMVKDNPQLRTNIAQILAAAIQEAKILNDTRSHAYALGSLGGLYEQTNQLAEAQDLTQQALILAQTINAPDIVYPWQWQLGRLLKKRGDIKGAIATYDAAVNTLKSLRSDLVAVKSDVQFSFRDSVEPIYREFVGLLLQSDNGDSSKSTRIQHSEVEPSQDRLEQARKVIESLQLAELDNFFQAACVKATPAQIDTIDPKAAVIYPIILADRLEVILTLPQQPLRHYAVALPKDQVELTVVQLRQALLHLTSRKFLPLSQQVYDWLIRPAEADLAHSQVQTLVFVLDGSLRNIPMAVLHNGKEYLIEKYGISVTPGLELLEPQPLTRAPIEVLKAGLSEARQGFAALPYVANEIAQIQAQVPGKVLLNQQFTKTTLQNAIDKVSFPVVHLATHGQFSSKAEDTFILAWDGRINVRELNNLLQTRDLRRTPIELLVLSACETAEGDNRAALGIAGVALRAGARSTLATLWVVDDEGTAALMSRFYQELTNAKVTKAEALRRAQLSILQNPKYRQQPYYWAPYILVGNWL
jgi:CHAT domain-containing protein